MSSFPLSESKGSRKRVIFQQVKIVDRKGGSNQVSPLDSLEFLRVS